MTYTPRGNVKAILDGMAEKDAALEWSSDEVAGLVGMDRKGLSQTLKAAIREGALHAEKRGRATFYSLTPFEQEQPEAVEFNAALYLDGDVVIYGAQANEDGSFTLTAEQLAKLKKLVTWSPVA